MMIICDIYVGTHTRIYNKEVLVMSASKDTKRGTWKVYIRYKDWQKDSEIRTLQGQLNESLNLCEKLNSENKAENVQVLKNELKQTKELLQNEKEKKKRADSIIEECQDKLRQAEQEKQYALTHQKKVEIPVE